jgi:hypothetical protein
MQEHPHFDQASQRTKKEDTAGQASTYIFLNYFEKIVAPSF